MDKKELVKALELSNMENEVQAEIIEILTKEIEEEYPYIIVPKGISGEKEEEAKIVLLDILQKKLNAAQKSIQHSPSKEQEYFLGKQKAFQEILLLIEHVPTEDAT